MILAAALVVACGARTGLPDQGPPFDQNVGDCNGTPIAATAPIPNLYLVLDTSQSMSLDSKWSIVRSVVATMMDQVGPRARFGVTVFPAPGSPDDCATGVEVMPLRLGDSGGVTSAAFLAATNFSPTGGTPTAATLEMLKPTLQSFVGVTYVILATDGGPNCNADLTCNVDQCTVNLEAEYAQCPAGGPLNCCDPNNDTAQQSVTGPTGCLDGANTVQAASDLRALGIRTFVVGIPGSGPYADILDNVAAAGGTARSTEPYYYSVDTADTSQLESAIESVTLETLSCEFTLAQAPSDPGEVNVYVGGVVLPQNAGAGADGWTLEGTTLTLLGSTCLGLEAQPNTPVTVVEGCPTVVASP
jgi:hypothetical protein